MKTNKQRKWYYLLQLAASVSDNFYPNNFGTCRVTIEVTHNVGIPTFFPTTYTTQVFEYEPSGSNIVNVTATDADNVSIRGLSVISCRWLFVSSEVKDTLLVCVCLYVIL